MTTVTVPRGDLIVPGIADDPAAANYRAAPGATVNYPPDNPADPNLTVFDLSGWAGLLINFRVATGTAAWLMLQWCDHPAPIPVAVVIESLVIVATGSIPGLSAVLPVLAPYLYVQVINSDTLAATGFLSIRPSRLALPRQSLPPGGISGSISNLLNLNNVAVPVGVTEYVLAPYFGKARAWSLAAATNIQIALIATDRNKVELFHVDDLRSTNTAAFADISADVPIPPARTIVRVTNTGAAPASVYLSITAYYGTG
jgi:hypothetical protein